MMSGHSMSFQSPPLSASGHRPMGSGDMRSGPNSMYSPAQAHPAAHATTLPPFSSIETMGRGQPSNVSSMRYHPAEQRQQPRTNGPEAASGSKRAAPPTSSAVTSADSTDVEEDDGGLPASGLTAPWEVLRGLADVAIERAAQVREH